MAKAVPSNNSKGSEEKAVKSSVAAKDKKGKSFCRRR